MANQLIATSAVDCSSVVREYIHFPKAPLSLHLFVGIKKQPSEPGLEVDILSWGTHNDGGWHKSYEISGLTLSPGIVSTCLNNHLYSYSSIHQKRRPQFFRTASINLNEEICSLKTPPLNTAKFKMCSFKNCVCLCDISNSKIFSYNCERDEWFNMAPINISRNPAYAHMTAYNNALYVVTKNGDLYSYDNRTSRWIDLPKPSGISHLACYVNEGKLYVFGSTESNQSQQLQIFDPVGKKWQSSQTIDYLCHGVNFCPAVIEYMRFPVG